MKSKLSVASFVRIANLFEIIGVLILLTTTFIVQFVFNELPCPLCLLQRYGFIAIAFGFLLNFRFGFRASHYSIILIGSLFTAFVALRQIALHVLPGTGSYGGAILGLHLYTWSFIAAMLIVNSVCVLLGLEQQYLEKARKKSLWQYLVHGLFAILVFLTIANIVSTLLECGFAACPGDPNTYILLTK